ncbi:uncharacterized mitochondrial protein AtMg00310-like [Lycium ferocissimum]|uniref:uncharacterized mitochondrial protein AtMg00310-like n=1 Tax=Lycium ferocissimum TaxID=112874 RepID=UPI0028150F5A|nr:uncharacterized mitochondrial protein AtMg00310-like [Lycium ferocissimum]
MPVYLLSGMNPSKGVIRKMHSIFSRFFWPNTGDKKDVHWVKWETLSLPKDEGGLGFRSLFELSNALFCKLWWNLITKPSLWSSFMINKYCKKLHPMIAQAKRASPIWRKLTFPSNLPSMIQYSKEIRPTMRYQFIYWDPPPDEGKDIHETTNIEAEAVAIKEAIYRCVANNIQYVLIVIDSMVMKNIIENT